MGNLIGAVFKTTVVSSTTGGSKENTQSTVMRALHDSKRSEFAEGKLNRASSPLKTDPFSMVRRPSASNVHVLSDGGKPFDFVWKHDASHVVLTGSFDNWSQSIPLTKDSSSDVWKAILVLDPQQRWLFKFVVDGVWRCSLDFGTETDAEGNVNNVIYPHA